MMLIMLVKLDIKITRGSNCGSYPGSSRSLPHTGPAPALNADCSMNDVSENNLAELYICRLYLQRWLNNMQNTVATSQCVL